MRSRNLIGQAGLVLANACGSIVDAPSRDTPFIYLLLSPSPVTRRISVADSTPWALVASTITPIDARYRSVDRFRLRRESDGASFVWRSRQLTGKLGAYFGVVVDSGTNANVVLTAAGDSGALGWRSLLDGATYSLDVMSEGVAITGVATIPERPVLQLTEQGTAHVVRWNKVAGAAGYFVETLTALGSGRVSTDTAYVWCEQEVFGAPPPRVLRVVALDQNAYRYLADSTLASAGVTGALGLFGGANEAKLTLTGPPVPAAQSCFTTRP